jgi:RimJ/RimL family protein N-acetyltransferase
MSTPPGVSLRDVVDSDLPIFFEQQRDAEANRMAAFPAREHGAFMAHWAKIRGDAANVIQTIVAEGAVAGNIGSWVAGEERLVGYWVGREWWGRGIATAALREFVGQVRTRPLRAYVAKHNVGSIRVLEKCGFVLREAHEAGADGVEELLFELR